MKRLGEYTVKEIIEACGDMSIRNRELEQFYILRLSELEDFIQVYDHQYLGFVASTNIPALLEQNKYIPVRYGTAVWDLTNPAGKYSRWGRMDDEDFHPNILDEDRAALEERLQEYYSYKPIKISRFNLIE